LEHFSVFSNDFNFNTINVGDELVAVIIKNNLASQNGTPTEDMLELSMKNSLLSSSKFLSISNILNPSNYDPANDMFVRLGAKCDNNIKATPQDLEFFKKYGIFPYDLQIRRSTTLKNIVRQHISILMHVSIFR